MSYVDYSSHWVLDEFFTFLQANQLGANCQHLYDNLAVEHNINTTTVDGTHKPNSILGSYINKNPIATGSQAIISGGFWTPSAGVYQVVCENGAGGGAGNELVLEIFVLGSWRDGRRYGSAVYSNTSHLLFCDGSNVRITSYGNNVTAYYQQF